jgi:nucleotide-binding universal stress UspA family protein
MRELNRVLVPVDFSPCSDAAVGEAFDVARPRGAAIHLLHVWKASPFTMGGESPPTSLKSFALSEAGDKMKVYLAQLEGFGLEVRGRLAPGDPEEVILGIAESEGYDLIVMGMHGRHGPLHFLRGSVAEHVVRRATCPVLTVHSQRRAEAADEPGSAFAGPL